MQRFVLLLPCALLACGNTSATDDGGADALAETASAIDGACAESVAAYCNTNPCPSAAALIGSTCNGYVYEGCGYVNAVGAFGVDTGNTYVFDADGGLVGVESYFNGGSKCAAGPADAALSFCSCAQSCTVHDAGCGD